MTARFAGSRHLDERRRRRLAVGEDASAATSADAARSSRARAARPGGRAAHALPLRKFIPQRAWKIWLAGALLALTAAAALCAAAWADQSPHLLAPVATQVLGRAGGQMATAVVCLLLVGSGQLALLIRWVRSRSLHDFAGHFGVWGWAAAALFITAFSLLTNLHHAWGRLASLLGPFDTPGQMALAWLVPAVVAGAVILGVLLRDMDGCRASVLLMELAAGGGLAAAVLSLDALLPLPAEVRALPQNAAALFAATSLFVGLLLHARHVLYRSADPPQPRPSRWRPLVVQVLQRLTRRSNAAATTADDADEVTDPVKEHASRKSPRATTRKARKPATKKTTASPAEPEPGETDEDESSATDITPEPEAEAPVPPKPEPVPALPPAETRTAKPAPSTAPAPPPAPAAKPQSAAAADDDEDEADESASDSDPQFRVDGAHDKASLKGLSKRERRKLQKQWREEQRGH